MAPLKIARLTTLQLAWAFAVIGGSVGLNALIKSNQQQTFLRKHTPPPTVLSINVNDAFHSGVVATTMCTILSILTSSFSIWMLVPKTKAFAERTLRVQAMVLAFFTLVLLAAQIAFTVIFATREAQVKAFIGPIEVPQQIIQQMEQQLGTTSVYKKISYLKLVAILPWFTILFSGIAAATLFAAANRIHSTAPTASRASHTDSEKTEQVSPVDGKHSVEHQT